MNSFDRQLVSFVLAWLPYGGPTDEDTFPRFGLRAKTTRRRFDRIVTAAEAQLSVLDESDAELILRARQHGAVGR